MRSQSNAFTVVRAVLITIVCSVTVYLLYNSGQDLERRFNPVVGKLLITKMEKATDDTTRVWVQFEKLRECRPIEVYWYHGRRDGLFERVMFQVEKPLGAAHYVNRPLGVQRSGPWLVGVPIEDIAHQAFADAQHDCNPLWSTVSRFYN